MTCPKCHRDTYSKKWGTCTSCDSPVEQFVSGLYRDPVTTVTAQEKSPSVDVTHVTGRAPIVAQGVTPVMGRAEVVTSVIEPGEECPTCHRKMPSKNALKQAAWRARRS